ncbi:nucleoside deaminase [Sphingobacterium deserti]|uniref:Cmp/dcmp deaminase zinc-binding protein n=1 Tax=Sphingobacterium deserti TaxID=1229276 RepID=A0A0B8T1U8_9SPHI|nr:nucleoside deaminase [Sphingobacterium deserti]KGE12668.1 cmp/dcmp deaminase zinc-binding protein [Sphingobacterium deserti]
MEEDLRYMRKAILLAEGNLKSLDGGPFGCVIVKDGKVLSAEANTVNRDCDPTAHAEMNAIRKAAKILESTDLAGCVLYTSGEPCSMCLSAIYWSNIKQVFYGNTRSDAQWAGFADEYVFDQLQSESNEQDITFERLAEKQAIRAFKQWVDLARSKVDNNTTGTD